MSENINLSEEKMQELLDKNKHVFELRDKFSSAANDMGVDDIENALAMFITHIYLVSCDDMDEADARLALLFTKILAGLRHFKNSGLTSWDENVQ